MSVAPLPLHKLGYHSIVLLWLSWPLKLQDDIILCPGEKSLYAKCLDPLPPLLHLQLPNWHLGSKLSPEIYP